MKKFDLGKIYFTCGVNDTIAESKQFTKDVMNSLARYAHGDWGDSCDEDKQANDYAAEHDERVLAAYETCKGKIWIITEWDRSATTILFPDEY